MMLVTQQKSRLVPLTNSANPHAPGCSRAAARSSLCHYESQARIPASAPKRSNRLSSPFVKHAALSLELERAPEHHEAQILADAPILLNAEKDFDQLLGTQDLDEALQYDQALQAQASRLQSAVSEAISQAFPQLNQPDGGSAPAHLLLQRILYKINRMNFFWYDDLSNYSNERSIFLANLRDAIETPWQVWELEQLSVRRDMSPAEVQSAIRSQAAYDVDPDLSKTAQYIRNEMSLAGYKYLLAVGSVDGLVEASRQSRVCAGAANEVMCAVFRVLMEEYGTGRFNKKHSTFYAAMMRELGLSDRNEDYLHLVPWQSLAAMNHNFLLTERRRHYLRYLGGLTFFEVNGPSVYRNYLAAAQRLGLSDDASGYWALHIKEDERHGRQMVEDVAVPLIDMYPGDAWEVLLGYDQEKAMGLRAGNAMLQSIKQADQGSLHL